jgi:hypothetical protein
MLTILVVTILGFTSPQAAGSLTAASHSDPAPTELADAVRARIAPGGTRATANGVGLTFWWVRELRMKGGTSGPAWSDVEEGTLVGAVRIGRDFRDIRGKVMKPGVYTLRYGIQPANGDHLGVSPFREFLLLSPAAVDGDPSPHGHDGTVDLSKQTIGGSHPAVWSIDPPVTAEGASSIHTTELGHKALVVEVPVAREGKTTTLRFGLVLIGRIEA